MILYFDTSAFFKKYLKEAGSERVLEILSQAEIVLTSTLTELELVSTLEQTKRLRRILSPDYRKLKGILEKDLSKLKIRWIPIHEEIIQIAKRFIPQHALRAADAVQLASAIFGSKRVSSDIQFVCADKHLYEAARLERLAVLDLTR